MKFAYKAFDRAGKAVSSSLEATSLAEASDVLLRQGLFVSELAPETAGKTHTARSGRAGGTSTRLRHVSVFMRQLSILVSTGTPMVEAIESLERQLAEGTWRSTVHDLRMRVEQGSSLSHAMEQHPRYFDPVCRSLIAAGESGGKLETMLQRLSMLQRQQLKIRSSISGAMVYPTLLIFVCLNVLAVMLLFVLPRFEGLFQSLGSPLPPTTALVMDLSKFLRGYWWAVLAVLIGGVFSARMALGTESGRTWRDAMLIRLPQFGKLFRAFATARSLRVLGVLVEGRVLLLDAIRLTRDASGNRSYAALLDSAELRVSRGESLSAALEGSPLFAPSVVEAVRSGERSGQLGPVLTSVAEYLDEDNEITLRSLSSIVEPLILIVLGVLIGFVAVSMFLPLFDLATTTGRN